jgi:hypothetical protein
VKVSRAAAAGTDRKLPGEMGLGAGCEGSDFLVPDVNPFDLVLAAQRVGEPIEAVADDAIDPFDAGRDEDFGKLICILDMGSVLSFSADRSLSRSFAI